MAPNHPINFLFNIVETSVEAECYFCSEIIVPSTDFYTVLSTIPGKRQVMQNHLNCFEQLAWSMMNFVFQHQGVPQPEGVLN